jgi:hypothetical protein
MTPKLTPLVLNATLLFVSACGGGSAMPLDDAFPDRSEFAVEVENNHFADAQVYVVFQGGSRRRVGTVTGKTSKSFTLRHKEPECDGSPRRRIPASDAGATTADTYPALAARGPPSLSSRWARHFWQ